MVEGIAIEGKTTKGIAEAEVTSNESRHDSRINNKEKEL